MENLIQIFIFTEYQNQEANLKGTCPRVKAKNQMLIFLDCWPTFVCLLLSGPFPINTTSTSKAPTTLPGFLPSKSLCCHGNLMFSREPNQQHPLIASMKVVQTPIPLRYRSYPVMSVPIFTCYNT